MINISPATPEIGAEISGVDVRNLDDAAFRLIYRAFLDHIVIVVRGQHLTEQDFLDFSARFGELKPHITKKAHHPQYPDLLLMDNRILDTRKADEAQAHRRCSSNLARYGTRIPVMTM